MVSKSFFKSNIESFKHPPEIQRIPLEKAILVFIPRQLDYLLRIVDFFFKDSKLLDFGPPKEVLALAIDPPNLKNLRSTVMLLKEIGALLMTSNGVENEVRCRFLTCFFQREIKTDFSCSNTIAT